MPAKKDIVDCCVVCSDTGHGYHFGVVACRACAAFFRRTAAFSLKYECRFGGHCTIRKSMGHLCRKCRHTKCLKVGMKPDAIQFNRDSFGGKARPRQTVEVCQGSPSTSAARPEVVKSLQLTAKEMLMARVNQMFFHALSRSDRRPLPSVLGALLQGYREIQNSREKTYSDFKIIGAIGPETDEEEAERVVANCGIYVRMIVNEVEFAARMLTSFTPFMQLPPNERMLLFQHFWPVFLRFERSYVSSRMLVDFNDVRTVFFDGTVLGGPGTESTLKCIFKVTGEELIKFFEPSRELNEYFLNVPLKLLKPSEVEFIAMCAHMLWTAPNLEGISSQTLQFAREMRAKIYLELHQHYTEEMNMHIYAPRIAELHCIIFAVETAIERAKDDILLVKVFDLAAVDPKVMELFA